jgi:hypothetical protein
MKIILEDVVLVVSRLVPVEHTPHLVIVVSLSSIALTLLQPNAYMRATAVAALAPSHKTKRSHPFHHRSLKDSQSVFLLQYLEASRGDTRRIGPLALASVWQLQISPNEVFRPPLQEMERIPTARSEAQAAI